jgi:hypothetical protein
MEITALCNFDLVPSEPNETHNANSARTIEPQGQRARGAVRQ